MTSLNRDCFDWNDQAVAHLTKRWAEGASGAEISRELPGTTRMSIIGKAHRLCLPKHSPEANHAASQANRKMARRQHQGRLKPKAPPRLPRSPAPPPRQIPANASPRPFSNLQAGQCRWPLDLSLAHEATTHDLFCGAPAEGPYCAAHAQASRGREVSAKELIRDLRRFA